MNGLESMESEKGRERAPGVGVREESTAELRDGKNQG